MLQACDPTDLGLDWFKYIREYCDAHRTRYGWDRKGASNLGRLQAKMRSSIMIRRRSVDVLTQLPPIRRQAIVLPAESYLNLIRAEWKAFNKYESILAELEQARENLDGDQDNLRELVKTLTDTQSLAWSELAKARKDVGLAKVDHTLKHVQHMIDSRGKVVLFSWHRDVVEQLMTGLEKERLNPVRLTGADSMMVRQTSVDKFQDDPAVKVIVLNLEAGGVGITLTGSEKAGFCTSVVFSELDWRPSTMAQAEARVWRRSVDESAQNVLVHHIVIDGSLDANISNKLLDKQDVIDQAIN
jgi:SWI/SNF-related matrix-associated actin-dependent regulator 1 of chromatin subfamily A